MTPLYLKKGEERRLRTGHPWVYNNEIDVGRARLRGLPPGEPVEIRDHRGEPLASAYANPHSLIAARIVSREPGVRLERGLLAERLGAAEALRRREFDAPWYRMVFGESDALPGLIVDRYGDIAVAQITTAGMERVREDIVALLHADFGFRSVVLRNDTPARTLEGLESGTQVTGEPIGDTVTVEEGGGVFEAAPLAGQKTGWYFDHRANRARLASRVAGRRVLDLYSYTGAWGIQCALGGASEVHCIDSSANAIDLAMRNAARNGVADRVRAGRSDAVRALKALRSAGERFDVVVLDPPAFIRRRKDRTKGFEAYRRANGLAIQLLSPGGTLVSASCSAHLERTKHLEIIARVSYPFGLHPRVVGEGSQDRDHPVHPALPETGYLRAFFVEFA